MEGFMMLLIGIEWMGISLSVSVERHPLDGVFAELKAHDAAGLARRGSG
jgi:hypothetical protein